MSVNKENTQDKTQCIESEKLILVATENNCDDPLLLSDYGGTEAIKL